MTDLATAFGTRRRRRCAHPAALRRVDLQVDTKPDLTPVSDADLACETLLRDRIGTALPNDRILGEEFGGEALAVGRQWVIDPIDGTKNFVRGVPVWATLIALIDDGVPVVGVSAPPWAGAGGRRPARAPSPSAPESAQPRRIGVSSVAGLTDASLAFSSLSGWGELGLRGQFVALTDEVWRVRGFGDFWNYCLVAEGAVDIAAEPEVSLWTSPRWMCARARGGRAVHQPRR